ncbi:MAG TPA: TetR/AcrR family transcriptional regulator [Chryseolinea sp.]|nr:TetR/AcrR family transcriptional regulator [Chryseolinea sp.]HPH47771.1 TetR/AcrR family transcriptional regulator [Chryseolinea sp.]HPM32572.1 TetR/AcrR family transcriptional regulator [Chryseolinea sp.]
MEETGTKEKILNGAVELFMKYGLRSISMDDIARHLTVSKKTLYQHFADKEDLITVVLSAHIEENRKQYEAITENSVNAIDELAQISQCLRKDMSETNPSVLFDLQKFHPKAWEVWLNHKNKYIRESVVRNIKQGIEEGYYREDVNPDVLAAIRIELISMGFDQSVFPQSTFSLAEVQSQIFDHFVYGLCTDKGKKLYQKQKEQHA